MARETLEDLRERLLRQHNVQQMIQVRAYEIYRMRGGQPGGEAQDWLHAEGEVLAFLIAHESAREDERAEAEIAATESAAEARQAKAPATRKPRAQAKAKPSTAKQATTKQVASKRATPRKSEESKSKAKRTSRQSKIEEST